MPATAIQTLISATPAPAAASAADTRGSTADGGTTFDSHLDTARQQHAGARSDTAAAHHDKTAQASHKSSTEPANGQQNTADDPSTDASAAKTAKASGTDADDTAATDGTTSSADSQDDGAAADVSVAGAMLALLGQAMPANASAATGGAAKVMAASVLKASLGTAASDATAQDAMAQASGDAAGDTTTAAAGQGGSNAAAAFADLFAHGLPKQIAARQDDAKGTDALAALLPATAQATTTATAVPVHTLSIASPVGSTDFTQQLGQQIAWLGNQDIKQARIRLHPEDLGSLDVKVSVQHTGQVDVSFAAQHPATVHALQQTLPQLDSLLAQQGLSLGQAQVGQQSNGGGSGHGQGSAVGGDGGDASIDDVAAAAPVTVSALGLVDAFA